MFIRSQKNGICQDLTTSRLRSEISRLTLILAAKSNVNDCNDDFYVESMRSAELGIRKIRQFIPSN